MCDNRLSELYVLPPPTPLSLCLGTILRFLISQDTGYSKESIHELLTQVHMYIAHVRVIVIQHGPLGTGGTSVVHMCDTHVCV